MSMEWDDNERGCFSALGLGMGKSASSYLVQADGL